MRMLLIMGVTLYTSRVVLRVLGVEDFGIYNVVGGVVSIMSFFISSLSNVTQRYMNIGLGKQDLMETGCAFRQSLTDRKSTRLNSSHTLASRMPSSA